MADDEFVRQTAAIAINEAEHQLREARHAYENAAAYGDAETGSHALSQYAEAKARLDVLHSNNRQQNNNSTGQLSAATRNFLSRRVAGGDELTPARWQEYLRGHHRAIAAGFEPDTTEYFHAVAGHVDSAGDGRQPPLGEQEAARISGISEAEYAQHAQTLRYLKSRGMYNE